MHKSNHLPDSAGVTMVELIIGMAVASMIFLAVSSLIVLLFSSNNRVKQLEVLAQAKNDLQFELSNAIKWGNTITFANTPYPQIVVDSLTYRLENERIYKNDIPLTAEEVRITEMLINNYSVNPLYASLDINISLEHKNFAVIRDQLHLVVSQRPGEITVNVNPPRIFPSVRPPSPTPAATLLPTPVSSINPTPTPTVRPRPRPTVRPRPTPTPTPRPRPLP